MSKRRCCETCRYWSDLIARAVGGGPVEALCLATVGPYRQTYTVASQACGTWAGGQAIDDPDRKPA